MSDAFALAAHAALAAADPAFFGAFVGSLAAGGNPPVAVQVLLDQSSEAMGDFGEVLVGQHLATFMAAGRDLAVAGAVLTVGPRSFTLERKVFDDGVTARWSAARV